MKNGKNLKKIVAIVCIIACLAMTFGCAKADKYPSKPIEYVCQAKPGGSSDQFVRGIADLLNKEGIIDQTFVITNKPGGGGAVSYTYSSEKKGDPYVWQNVPSTMVTLSMTTPGAPSYKDFWQVGLLAIDPLCIAVSAESPYQTLEDLINSPEAQGDGLTWAFSGIGSYDHLTMVQFGKSSGANVVALPFESDSEAITAILGGHAHAASGSVKTFLPQIEAGMVRLLAVTTPERIASVPEVPTLKECGIDFEIYAPRGIFCPQDIPEDAYEYILEKTAQ